MPTSTSPDQTQLPTPISTHDSTTSAQSNSSSNSQVDTANPQSNKDPPTKTPTTPTERNFFGALAQIVRERSRSRGRKEAKRPSAAISIHPSQASKPTPSSPMSPRPRGARHSSGSSVNSAKRVSTSGSELSEFEKFSYGRHSNDWLFGGFSFKQTARQVFRGPSKSDDQDGTQPRGGYRPSR